jgi:hypothetical protein
VALVRTDVSEEFNASFIRVTRIRELGTILVTANVVPNSPILVILMKEAQNSSETSALTTATRRNIPEDTILHRWICIVLMDFREYVVVLSGLNWLRIETSGGLL